MTSPEAFRRWIPIPRSHAYLNTAATAPTPDPVRKAMAAYELDRACRAEEGWDDWVRQVTEARRVTARYFEARPEEVAFVSNTGHGINTVAHMLPWKPGDEIVTDALEFPSNRLPWLQLRKRGVRVKTIGGPEGPIDVDAMAKAVTERTRLVAVSWVSYKNGQVLDLAPLAEAVHAKGGYLLVDTIQAAGAIRPRFRRDEMDFLANGGHKWMMAPFGVGTFLVRRALLSEFEPPFVGWANRPESEPYTSDAANWMPTAGRFEMGNLNFGGVMGWKAAVGAVQGVESGPRTVLRRSRRAMELADELGIPVVTPRSAHAGIVSLKVPDAQAAKAFLQREGVSVAKRGDWMRVSTHFWTSEADLAKWRDALAKYLRRQRMVKKRAP